MTNHPNRKRSSGQTVALIRTRSGFANVPDTFAVLEPGAAIDELTQETADYYLPAGYTVARSNLDTLEIYDPQGDHCEIVMVRGSRRPKLVSGASETPVLKQAEHIVKEIARLHAALEQADALWIALHHINAGENPARDAVETAQTEIKRRIIALGGHVQ